MGIKKGLVGFTLIEMIVVIAVIAITLPSIFAIVFTIARQQTKIYRISKVKKEGDYILNLISNTIKNSAVSIHSSSTADDSDEVCIDTNPYANTSLYFRDLSNDWFGYSLTSNVISSASSSIAYLPLNSDKIRIESFNIKCEKNAAYSTSIISINFTICYKTGSATCVSTRPEETASLYYQTKVKMRN